MQRSNQNNPQHSKEQGDRSLITSTSNYFIPVHPKSEYQVLSFISYYTIAIKTPSYQVLSLVITTSYRSNVIVAMHALILLGVVLSPNNVTIVNFFHIFKLPLSVFHLLVSQISTIKLCWSKLCSSCCFTYCPLLSPQLIDSDCKAPPPCDAMVRSSWHH